MNDLKRRDFLKASAALAGAAAAGAISIVAASLGVAQ
jgi:anaerobic selenocysteine-containing dehydrogenase